MQNRLFFCQMFLQNKNLRRTNLCQCGSCDYQNDEDTQNKYEADDDDDEGEDM
jgi:hypothetical protein